MLRILPALLLAACTLAAAIPRPEYPQPQFQRENWMNLNGSWEFEFDDSNVGITENWASGARKFGRSINVPFCFESKLSGIAETGFHPWAWYRRTVTTPADWKGKRTLLNFGAVDYHATVWINGQRAGEHEGGSVPFVLDITAAMKPGANTITVRAFDPPRDRSIPRGKQYWEEKSAGIFYTRTSGIWQTVWLEATGDSYISYVRTTTAITGAVRFEAEIARPKPGLEFTARVRMGATEVAVGTVKVNGRKAWLEVRIPQPRLWNVGAGNLYDVTFELGDDKVQSYFGIREVRIHAGRIHINGRPIYVKMVLDQGYWPESTITPPSDEAMQFDIKAMQQMGFNGARKHQKVEDPRWLYWCDKLGFLVSGEIANAYDFEETYVARFTREWMEVIARDYNHPSIIMWVPINESWGTGELPNEKQEAHLRANYWLTKSLDSTRPVIENDGWEHVDTTDLFALHDYARNGELLYEKYKNLGKESTIPGNGRAALVPGYKYNGTPFLLSEFGGIAYVVPGSPAPPGSWGYSGVEATAEAALARLTSLYQGLARLPQFVGICYTQLTDVEQEMNGLLTYDRKMKFDPAKIKALNALLN